MKLTTVTVKNFRSYVATDDNGVASLDIGDGLNLLVGPNNAGKSNLLRSIALALEDFGGNRFDPTADTPQQLSWAYPTITLSFRADPSKSVERTMLKYLAQYEKSAGTKQTYASQRQVHYRVRYTKTSRDDHFVTRGAGNRRGDPDILEKCKNQFRRCIRFIYLRSGENLQSFLAGTFHELLHTVLEENLKDKVRQAESRRARYIEGLRDDLLKPLGIHSLSELRDVMTEIQDVVITPYTPTLSSALSEAEVFIRDSAQTSILSKGTGVRGALLVALLSYLAKNSRRSLILAVEEPESFLHPMAQEELRSDLARLAERSDVSLLVTTHSPFLLDRSETTKIVPFSKDADGVTCLGTPVAGSESHVPAISCLFGETITPTVLERIEPLKSTSSAVLFVEGFTDKFYLEFSAGLAQREDLLEGIEIRFGGGASKTALEALLFKQLAGEAIPALAVFDWDTPGKNARDTLKKFNWNGKYARTYRDWLKKDPNDISIEAEDLLSQRILKAFLKTHGDSVLADQNRFKDDTFHYGFTQPAKDQFCKFLTKHARTGDVKGVVEFLADCRQILGI